MILFRCFRAAWKEVEDEKPKTHQRDVAFFILTETSLADELKADYPNGNLIYREDYQKSFKKGVRWSDTKRFLRKYAYFQLDLTLL